MKVARFARPALVGVALTWLNLFAVVPVATAQTGVDDDRISLPEGPGSLEGVGENVEVDPNMALMRWNIPIITPKGFAGMTPELSLSYASGNGGGPFGIGWSMSTPTIERMTSRGTPRYDVDDFFAADGGDELVMTEDAASGERIYRERFENKFHRYVWVAAGDGKEGYWRVDYPDGRVGYFGADAEGNLVESARTSHPDGGTYRYHLVTIVDPYGHELRYNYDKFGGNKTLLTDIQYVFIDDEPQYSVQFDYELRQDLLSDAGAGFEELLEYRTTRVRVLHKEQIAREYVLGYEDYTTSGGFSRLTDVETFGVGGQAGGLEPNPIRFSFGYSRALGVTCADGMGVDCDAEKPYIRTLPAIQGGVNLGNGRATLIDINGDSLPDVLDTTDGSHKFFINELSPDGNGGWTQAFSSAVASQSGASLQLSAENVQVMDINGDGHADIVDTVGGNFLLNDVGSADWGEVGSGFNVGGSTLSDFSNARFMDYDNDKKIDIVISDSSNAADPLRVYANNGADFDVLNYDGLGVAFSSPRVQLSDMNGDGLNDVIEMVGDNPVEVNYRLNLGRGQYGPRETISNLTIQPTEIANLDFEDLNGDGISDVVIVGTNQIKYMINRNGNTFDAPVTITSADIDGMIPERVMGTTVLYADMNANGSEDVVWFDSSGGVTYLELFPVRPNLISRIDNGIGFIQKITYGTSAEHAARAKAAGEPWEISLPNAMPVVDRVDVFVTLTGQEDGSGLHEILDYTYRNGFYDGVEKQFRGFGDVISTLRGDDTQEEGRTLYAFNLGDEDPWYNGLLERQVQESGGDILSEMTDTYEDCEVEGAAAFNGDVTVREQVRYICKTSSEQVLKERRPEAEWVTTRVEYEYDGFGNVTLERNLGDIARDGDELHTETEYASSSSRWIISQPAKVITYNDASLRAMERAEVHYFYDGDDFQGLPNGEVDQGFLTRRASLIELPGTFIDEERNRRDEHGNIIERLDPLGDPSEENAHRRVYTYDPMGLYVVAIDVRLSDASGSPYQLRREARYDFTLGVTLEATSWMVSRDGTPETARRSTLVSYDHLARITSIERPGDEAGKPSSAFAYELEAPVSRVALLGRSEVGGEVDEESYRCFDGKGRLYQTRTKTSSGKFTVTGFKAYNARGTAVREYQPYTSTSGDCEMSPPEGVLFTTTKLDATFRPIEVTMPDDGLYGSASVTRTQYLPLAQVQYDEEDTFAGGLHEGTPTTMRMDGLGRTVGVDRLLGDEVATFQLLYDNTNSLAGYVDPAGNRHEQTRDLKGRILEVKNPNIGSVKYTYDAAGNVTHTEDSRGAIMRMAYDGMNRKVERWDEADRDGTLATLRYDLDPDCPATECTNTPGVLASARYSAMIADMGGVNVVERIGYDVRGRQVFSGRNFEGLVDLTQRLTYDNSDRIKDITYPDGTTVSRTYDSAGRTVAIPGYVSEVTYGERDLLEQLTFANGATMAIGYDDMLRFDTVTSKDGGGEAIEGWDYTRDRTGNILNVIDLGTRAARPSTAADFVYDDWYRVVTSQLSVGTEQEEVLSYSYDTINNILSRTSSLGESSPGHVGEYTYGDRPNMVTSAGALSMEYDIAGHMTSRGDAGMVWDYMGRLAEATGANGKAASYAYGVAEERVAKVEDGSLTLYGYGDFQIRDGVAVTYVRLKRQFVARHETPGFGASFYPDADGDGSITAGDAYAAGSGGAVSQRAILMASAARALSEREDAKAFFHSDHLGSLTATTDEGGAVRGQRAYYPFGDIRWEEGYVDEYGFTGQELDRLTGLLHFQFRYLDPKIGRWASFDPLFVKLDEDSIAKYAQFNGYAYVSNNPLNSVDPLGLGDDDKPKSGAKGGGSKPPSRPPPAVPGSGGDKKSSDTPSSKPADSNGKNSPPPTDTPPAPFNTDQSIAREGNAINREGNADSRQAQADNLTEAKRANDASERSNSLTETAQVQNLEQAKEANRQAARANDAAEEANKIAKEANKAAIIGSVFSGISSLAATGGTIAAFLALDSDGGSD